MNMPPRISLRTQDQLPNSGDVVRLISNSMKTVILYSWKVLQGDFHNFLCLLSLTNILSANVFTVNLEIFIVKIFCGSYEINPTKHVYY